MTSLKKQTVNGIKWLVGASFAQKVLSIVTTIVLARILSPSIFGLFALALVAIDGLSLFRSLGFDSAVIQRKDNIDRAANTAFFIVPLLGFLIYLALSLSAPAIGKFFNAPELVAVLKVLGLVFIISSFANIPKALLQKRIQFNKVSIAELSGQLMFSAAAIIFAVYGFGIWSLVYAYVLKVLVIMIFVWEFAKWRPRLEFDKKIAVEMFHFGKFVFLSAIVWFLKVNFDKLFVGKLLGTSLLGLYAIAYNVANSGSEYFGSKIYRVLFPAYSKIQDDPDGLRSAYKKVLRYASIIVLPLGVGIFLLGGDFLRFAFGEKWIGAIPILKILAWVGIFTPIATGSGSIFLALGKSKLTFWISLAQVVMFVALVTPAVQILGLTGIALLVVLISFVAMIIRLHWIMKLLKLKAGQIYESLRPALFSSSVMGLGIVFLKYYLSRLNMNAYSPLNFILLFIIALALYGFSMLKNNRMVFREIKNLIFL